MKVLFIITILIASLSLSAQNCATGSERVESVNQSFEKEVLKLTNKERKKKGLSPLKWNNTLGYSARYHAKDMATDDYFDHASYDRKSNGKLKEICGVFDRIEAFIDFPTLAENISAGRTTPQSVVESWMNSSGHKKNTLNKDFTEIGIGYYRLENSEYEHYWVQNFGGK